MKLIQACNIENTEILKPTILALMNTYYWRGCEQSGKIAFLVKYPYLKILFVRQSHKTLKTYDVTDFAFDSSVFNKILQVEIKKDKVTITNATGII